MSEQSIPLIVTAAAIALMFGWVQVLNFACPHWRRALKRRRLKIMNPKRNRRDRRIDAPSHRATAQAAPSSSLSSRRLATQSRDLLQAISARGDGTASHSHSTTTHTPFASQ
jgi:hypothetical protein